jgi:uncharacterized Zn-finger protein
MPTEKNRKAQDSGRRERTVEITAAELPLHCPTADQMVWNAHPRVFLPIEESGEALCPYCGTRYVLKDGTQRAGH